MGILEFIGQDGERRLDSQVTFSNRDNHQSKDLNKKKWIETLVVMMTVVD